MRRGLKNVVFAALLPALVILVSAGASAGPQERGEIGFKVTEFSLPTYDGGTFTEKNLVNKVTLLVFWFPT